MRKTVLLAVLLGAVPVAPAAAQTARPRRPTLFVHVAVDQMRYDYLERYRGAYDGGLARLLNGGAVFSRAYQDHAMTETAPGHSTMLSGRYPSSTGIVRNALGVSDTAAPLVEAEGPGASPRRFQGTSLLDWLRRRWPAARMLSVSRKDRGAILPVGRSRRNVWVYWFAGDVFTTSRYYAERLPDWVRRFNVRVADATRPGLAWTLLRDSAAYPEPDSNALENRGRRVTFPHRIDELGIEGMPWMDSLVLALALDGMRELRLGRRGVPDVVSVSLSTLDAIGHAYGPESREVHDLLLRIDRYLGAFLDSLDARYGRDRVVVSLASDHGVTPGPGSGATLAPPVWVDSAMMPVLQELRPRLGAASWTPSRSSGWVALDRAVLEAAGVNVDSVADELARRLRSVPGVAQVDTRATLAAADTARDDAARRWRRALFPGVPGEVFITLAPRRYFGRSSSWNHGQASDDDAHVPVIIMGPGVRPGLYAARASVVDLGPTLAAIAGVRPRERVDGRVLREALP